MPKISAYPAGTPLQSSDKFVIARGGQNYYILGSSFLPKDGEMRNGKISVTVAANNLTLALKTKAGANPSASDPVLVYIGGAWRAITASLSVTKNAATNWCNLGGSELQTKEADLFAYLGYNSVDGITIGFARFPYARIYSDFSTTSTNEKYAGISTITNAAASDEYVVIGRFAATLSAGAGFTWSVPAYTAKNLVQTPIYATRQLSWTPVWTNLNNSTATIVATYRFEMDVCILSVALTFGASTAISGSVSHILPWTVSGNYGGKSIPFVTRYLDATAAPAFAGVAVFLTTTITLLAQLASGTYLQTALLSSTIPYTWAVNDEITYSTSYMMN